MRGKSKGKEGGGVDFKGHNWLGQGGECSCRG